MLAIRPTTSDPNAACPSAAGQPSVNDSDTLPSWLERLLDAYEAYPETWSEESQGLYDETSDPAAGLLTVIQPVMADARRRLESQLARVDSQQLDRQRFLQPFYAHLPSQLTHMIGRALVLAIHVAGAEGRLHGETPQDRYQCFLASLRNRRAALELLAEYPVLARQVQTRVDQWVSFGRTFVEHLQEDWNRLSQLISTRQVGQDRAEQVGRAGRVMHVEVRGDRHRGGKSVVIVYFDTGSKLVYKPKSLAVDLHFQDLIEWLNTRGLQPNLRTLDVIDCDDHGWMEHVERETCKTERQVAQYYARQGALLAVAQLIGGTDFHYENVIPAGEHPVLIDLEALFCPDTQRREPSTSRRRAEYVLDRSVLRTGLLPQPMWGDATREGIDLSGIGAATGQSMPFTAPTWEAVGTDQMRLVRKQAWFNGGDNRVTLNGRDVDPCSYVDRIEDGFAQACRLLATLRRELLAPLGPIRRFAGDSVRVLLRSTRVYGRLNSESFHPDLLRDEADRDEALQRLWRACGHRTELVPVVEHEVRDLQRGDFPLFTTRADSRDLWTSAGVCIKDFYQRTGLECAVSRLEEMSEPSIQRQRWLVQVSLAGVKSTESPAAESPAHRDGRPATVAVSQPFDKSRPVAQDGDVRSRLIRGAMRIGEQLGRMAILGSDDATWIGYDASSGQRGTPGPVELDLYDGLPGIALFLAHLGEVTGDRRMRNLAERAVFAMRRQTPSGASGWTSTGAFAGWGGIVYCLSQLGSLWKRDDLLIDARQLVARLRGTIDKDEHFDIIGGSAGTLAAILSLHACRPSHELLSAARQCGDRLLVGCRKMECGVAWPLFGAPRVSLAGYSHGVAGIAWSLLSLSSVVSNSGINAIDGNVPCGDGDTYRQRAMEALDYERSCYCSKQGNWLDRRPGSPGQPSRPTCATAWCHGAPGVGLGRVAVLPYLDDDRVRSEIDVAVRTTLASGFGLNHSLCHGDLGNAELLLLASSMPESPVAQSQLDRIQQGILDDIDRRGWICGSHRNIATPGLMTGLAGIGYGLLRMALPDRVPSVLTLQPANPIS